MYFIDPHSIGQMLPICLERNATRAEVLSLPIYSVSQLVRFSESVAFCLPVVMSHIQYTIFLESPAPPDGFNNGIENNWRCIRCIMGRLESTVVVGR